MSNVKIKNSFVGGKAIESKLKREIDDSVDFIAENIILGQATRDAPIDTSALRQSGRVTIKKTKNKTTAIIGFYTPYAAVQHENTTFQHPKGGKAYYLSDALKQNISKIKMVIAANIKKVRKF